MLAVRVDGELRAAEGGGAPAAGRGGHHGDRIAARHPRGRAVLHQGVGVGPVPHERRLPVLEREAGFFLVPGERALGHDRVAVDLVAHGGQGPHGRRGADGHLAAVEDPPSECAEVFGEHGHQPLVARALPHEPVPQPVLGAGPDRRPVELVEGRRRRTHQVGAPVQHPHVHEPRQGVEAAVPPVGRDRRGEEGVGRRPEAIEIENPARRGELRRPDGVELQDVGLAGPRVEPLDVELVPLVGRVRGGPLDHADLRGASSGSARSGVAGPGLPRPACCRGRRPRRVRRRARSGSRARSAARRTHRANGGGPSETSGCVSRQSGRARDSTTVIPNRSPGHGRDARPCKLRPNASECQVPGTHRSRLSRAMGGCRETLGTMASPVGDRCIT